MRILYLEEYDDKYQDMMNAISDAIYPDTPKIFRTSRKTNCKILLEDAARNNVPYDLLIIGFEPQYDKNNTEWFIRDTLRRLYHKTKGYDIPIIIFTSDKYEAQNDNITVIQYNSDTWINDVKNFFIKQKQNEVIYYA